uniref:Putative secreted protein n=1 Tax=Anopheles triannulatus TaxID=58253 RepID=A0A2M4B5H9_9DIPT
MQLARVARRASKGNVLFIYSLSFHPSTSNSPQKGGQLKATQAATRFDSRSHLFTLTKHINETVNMLCFTSW